MLIRNIFKKAAPPDLHSIISQKDDLLGYIISDDAYIHGSDPSAIVEQRLAERYLISNADARCWLGNCLYTPDGSIQNTLHHIYCYAQAGNGGYARVDNLLPLVEYTLQLFAGDQNQMDLSSTDIDKFLLDDMIGCIDNLRKDIVYIMQHKRNASEKNLEPLCIILEYIKEKLNSTYTNCGPVIFQLISLIIDYWKDIKMLASTYDVLQLIAYAAPWDTTPERRYQLAELIGQVTSEWSHEQ